jgi:rod shape-determining protein MreC
VKKFNPNKNIIITLILVIIAVGALSLTVAQRAKDEKSSVIQVVINDSVALVDKVVFAPARWFDNGVRSVQNLLVTYEENERLKEKVDAYDALERQNKSYEREVAALKEELELNATLTNFQKVTANVITRSPDSWQDMLVIDNREDLR